MVFALFLSAIAFGQSTPVAFLSQLYPDAIMPGHAQFQLTVGGSGFQSGAVVNWNGTPLVTTFTSVDRLEATVSAADVSSAGTATITVTNPGSIASNVAYFPVHRKSTSVAFIRYDIKLDAGYGGIAVADFNGDGKPDVAVTLPNLSGNASIAVYLNGGHRSFTGPVVTTLSCIGDSAVVGDFNGDGKLDVLTTNNFGSGCVLLGNGDGSFSQGPAVSLPDENYVAVGDFNRDGKLDLFLAGGSDGGYSAQVLLGNGDGSFSTGQSLGDIDNPQPPVVGDFNRDGKLDVAMADSVTASVWVYLGSGNGKFAAPVKYDTPNPAVAVTAVDLNGNGKLDLVTDGVTILQGNGDGTFVVGSSYTAPGGGVYLNPDAGDFNSDGRPDILLVQDSGHEGLALLLGNGDGTLQSPLTWPAGSYSYPAAIGSADFNGDGLLDAVVSNSGETISVFLQTTQD
jgi:hypothetical protein